MKRGFRAFVVVLTACYGSIALAASRPALSEAAATLLNNGGLFLIPGDNLAVPLPPPGATAKTLAKLKPVPFLVETPKRLDVLSSLPGEAVLAIDDQLYRLKGTVFSRLAGNVGAYPALSSDGTLVVSVEDQKTLKLASPAGTRNLRHLHSGRWEFVYPYITPDASQVLVALRDYTQPFDVYSFVIVNTKSLETEEVALSQNFVPGSFRQTISPQQVAIQIFSQGTDENGSSKLEEVGVSVFDFKTKKLAPTRTAGVQAAGKTSLLEGTMRYSEDRQCRGDETWLYPAGRSKPIHFRVNDDSVVSLLDFLPGEKGLVATILDLKTCKNRGVIIPLDSDIPPEKWLPLSLPFHEGRIVGRTIQTVKP